MSKDFGLKVSQPGVDVKTARDDQLVFSSKFQTLHVFQQGSGTVTDSGGRTITIPHNLGYVPRFLVHTTLDETTFGNSNQFFISPYDISGGGITGNLGDKTVVSWADTTNLYIKFGEGYGWKEYHTGMEFNNYAINSGTFGFFAGGCAAGNDTTLGNLDGAFRFLNVTIPKSTSIYAARCNFYIGTRGAGDVPVTVYGIAEDNTADFGGDPFGRTKTSASGNEQCSSSLGVGATWAFGVTAQVQEIINRAGWSSGNALGLFILDRAAGATRYIDDPQSGVGAVSFSYLSVLLSNTIGSYKYTIFLDKIIP